MKRAFLLLLFGMYVLTGYSQDQPPTQRITFTLPELELTDSAPIEQIDSIMNKRGYDFERNKTLVGLLDIQPGTNGSYTIVFSFVEEVSLIGERHKVGVFDYRGILFFVKNNIIEDFLRKTEKNRTIDFYALVFWNKKDNRAEFIEMAIDIPKFTFSYRDGEIKLIKVWW